MNIACYVDCDLVFRSNHFGLDSGHLIGHPNDSKSVSVDIHNLYLICSVHELTGNTMFLYGVNTDTLMTWY